MRSSPAHDGCEIERWAQGRAAALAGQVSYKITVRRGPEIKREQYETLNQAIAAIERHAYGRSRPVEALGRRYEADQIVAARIELKGASQRAGIDVKGDGTLVAWTGRIVRKELPGDDAMKALRQSVSVDP